MVSAHKLGRPCSEACSDRTNTSYALRRGFASTVGQNISKDVARYHMGHTANSTMFEGSYDKSNANVNLAGAVLGGNEVRKVVPVTSYLKR